MKIITEKQFNDFASKFFPSKAIHYDETYAFIQAGSCLGKNLHYECDETSVNLHIEGPEWRHIRDYLNANLNKERLTPSHWGRQNCQWTIDNEIHTAADVMQAFLDIRGIIEPVIEQFEGKEPQDYSGIILLQHDWNDTSDAGVANLDSNIPVGRKGYGVGKIVVELSEYEPIVEKTSKVTNSIEPIERKEMMVVEKKQNSVEIKNENVKQIPAATCGSWRTLSNTIGYNALRIEAPVFLRELDTATKKRMLIDAIQKAANDLDKDDFYEPNECVRFLRNLNKISSQISIDDSKTIFANIGWEKVFREDVGYEETATHEPTEKAFDMAKCKSLSEISFDFDGEWGVYNVKLYKDTNHKCDHCKGSKFVRCPNCDGSGREQYVDGYFANGDERIKTGQCHVCYGKGMIECEHCDGTGLKDKGTGCYIGFNAFRQEFESKIEGYYINKWFCDRLNDKGCLFAPDICDEDVVLLKENANKITLDNRTRTRDKFLETFGQEYAEMYNRLSKELNVDEEYKIPDYYNGYDEWGNMIEKTYPHAGGIWFLIKMSYSFSMYDSYRLSYNVDGEERNFLIVTNGKSSIAYWDRLPEMGLFGNIKKNR